MLYESLEMNEQIRVQLSEIRIAWEDAIQSFEADKEALEDVKEHLRLTDIRFANGLALNTEMNEARLLLIQAEKNLLIDRYQILLQQSENRLFSGQILS